MNINKYKKPIYVFILIFIAIITLSTLFFLPKKFITKYTNEAEKDTINIVSITDEGYIMPLVTMIFSAISNKNKSTKYHFFIITTEVNEKYNDILKYQDAPNSKITILNNKNNFYKRFKIRNENIHVSQADLLKFSLPEIFPKLDKILVLDCDTIILKDLSTLYNTDITDYYGAVIEESYAKSLRELVGVEKYFNNGIMLLNLEKMRKDNISNKLLFTRYFKTPKRYLTQDTFNIVFDKKVKFLDRRYNLIPKNTYVEPEIVEYVFKKKNVSQKENEDFIYKFYGINRKDFPTMDDYVKTSTIIHYAGFPKPWHANKSVKYANYWLYYYHKLHGVKYEK